MHLSHFGEKFAAPSGISELMEDLSAALADDPSLLFMGGGNPGRVEGAEQLFHSLMDRLLSKAERRHELLGLYQSPHGDRAFREEIASYLNKTLGWEVAAANVAFCNGSQSAFFILFNLLAGPGREENHKPGTSDCFRHIQLPFAPEYVGYRDVGLQDAFFRSERPKIDMLGDDRFRYSIDFEKIEIGRETGAVCLSRPSNPTGGMLTDAELEQLSTRCERAGVPLILDGAYGLPFPGLVYGGAQAFWNGNTVLTLSLSKLGLPGLRTGIVIAREDLIAGFNRANTVINLASSTVGPQLLRGCLLDGSLDALCTESLLPFYSERRAVALDTLERERGSLPLYAHQSEGGFFLWLWCKDLPIDSAELYVRLKNRGVIVLPGNGFFMGLAEPWQHEQECLRLSFAGDKARIEQGLRRVIEELRLVYDKG
ncbi:MAG: valine--pyruvate transaminase [Pseudomonadota bacterium]